MLNYVRVIADRVKPVDKHAFGLMLIGAAISALTFGGAISRPRPL